MSSIAERLSRWLVHQLNASSVTDRMLLKYSIHRWSISISDARVEVVAKTFWFRVVDRWLPSICIRRNHGASSLEDLTRPSVCTTGGCSTQKPPWGKIRVRREKSFISTQFWSDYVNPSICRSNCSNFGPSYVTGSHTHFHHFLLNLINLIVVVTRLID